MNAKMIPISLVSAAAALIAFYSCTYVVNEREQAIVTQFGEIQRVITEPGLHFKWPLSMIDFEKVIKIEDRLLTFESTDKTVQVRDGKRYLVDAIVIFRIDDAQKFRETVNADLRRVRDRLETRLDAALRSTYGRRAYEAALSKERAEMMREIRDAMRFDASGLGIQVADVRIKRTDLAEDVLTQTYNRMKEERLAEAEQLRAEGIQQKLRIEAEADREATVLVAQAQKQSEITRGEGEGERNRIFAEVYTKDPEFFEFYRSMKAYRAALEGEGTTMVLSPDSEFFDYFGKSKVAAPAE